MSTTPETFIESNSGQIFISILLGLGLAAMFRKACDDNRCIVVRPPSFEETQKYYYKVGGECWKYTPVETPCLHT
jgi:hypothetical protein